MLAFFAFALVFSLAMHGYLGVRFTGPLEADDYTWWGPPMRLDSRQEITVIELANA